MDRVRERKKKRRREGQLISISVELVLERQSKDGGYIGRRVSKMELTGKRRGGRHQ